MTRKEIREFALKQVEWYNKQIKFDKGQIEWTNKQLVRTRKEDKEQKEFAKTYLDGKYAHLYEGNYQGEETKKLLNERRRWQRSLKKDEASLAKYTKEAEEYAEPEEAKEEETEMKKYTIVSNEGRFAIYSSEESAFFAGYDFMGSVNWEKIPTEECCMTKEEAEQIVLDLEAADEPEPEDTAKKEYLLKTICEDIKLASIKTGKQIADIYELDQIAGIYASMEVWDLDTMKRISLLDLVEPILEQKRWMEQEYRDYCENEAYGDY